jgi:hypothetical protein
MKDDDGVKVMAGCGEIDKCEGGRPREAAGARVSYTGVRAAHESCNIRKGIGSARFATERRTPSVDAVGVRMKGQSIGRERIAMDSWRMLGWKSRMLILKGKENRPPTCKC